MVYDYHYLRTPSRYVDAEILREGYTPRHLTSLQHAAVIAVSSTVASICVRPIQHIQNFSFVWSTPGDNNFHVFGSDKRAHFFRTLFSVQWLRGTNSIPATAARFGGLVGTFSTVLPHAESLVGERRYFMSGALSGAAAGALLTVVQHPFDVLRAAAESNRGPKQFSGMLDVIWTSLKHNPKTLLGIYVGFSSAITMNILQYGILFGWYKLWREDLVARGPFYLFLGCQLGAFCGAVVAYPFMTLRLIVFAANVNQRAGMKLAATRVFLDMKKKHGVSKVYDGFFKGRPALAACGPALMLTLYDVCCRRYTEKLHPERKVWHSTPQQSMFNVGVADWVRKYA